MPASLIVIPWTIREISKFLGQLPVDEDDDDFVLLLINTIVFELVINSSCCRSFCMH